MGGRFLSFILFSSCVSFNDGWNKLMVERAVGKKETLPMRTKTIKSPKGCAHVVCFFFSFSRNPFSSFCFPWIRETFFLLVCDDRKEKTTKTLSSTVIPFCLSLRRRLRQEDLLGLSCGVLLSRFFFRVVRPDLKVLICYSPGKKLGTKRIKEERKRGQKHMT